MLAEEVGFFLDCRPGQVILDCTLGEGGHARRLVSRISPGGLLVGLERDGEMIPAARRALNEFSDLIRIEQANFADLADVLERAGIERLDGVLFDLGVNSAQLDTPGRGFSFRLDGPLDMRMDSRTGRTAADLINKLSRKELEWIIREYGEERWAGRISRRIVEERKARPILRTGDLAEIVSRAVPGRGRTHPATRTFQALRIYLNSELEALQKALPRAVSLLRSGGRICVISFHSLEDRIVKYEYRRWVQEGALRLLNKKPVRAGNEEVQCNPRARSAKLRAAEKL
ncbi:MAG: 16S rRNA (cytosine(1402)-N(4))-methyltransferase RsmH [PVC group bacterium]